MVAILNLKKKDIQTIKQALKKLQTTFGAGEMGSRSQIILKKYEQGINDVTLPEWNTIGLALSRLDTKNGYKLLNRITTEITS
jgi:hypothetical protein